jgi:cation diffusion facilitator family transporter
MMIWPDEYRQITGRCQDCFNVIPVHNIRNMSDINADNCCPRSWLGENHDRHARRTRWVVVITALMMVGEIAGGTWYGSMALVADGWHMATHAAALGVASLAYWYARHHAQNPRFSFGTGKVGELAGFGSAITLGIVALLIAWESLQRLLAPRPIEFLQAGGIAVLGLLVNLVSAWLLHDDHVHEHDHDDDHDHNHNHEAHQDTNLRAAYVHVLADAFTSVMAIVGLMAGRFLGWIWMDAAIGIVGAIVILWWSVGLVRTASRSLLDGHDDSQLENTVREHLRNSDSQLQIRDLHLWRLGPGHYGLLASLNSQRPLTPAEYKARLKDIEPLRHITIEVNPV